MPRPLLALTVSQHFDRVRPALEGIVGAYVVRDADRALGVPSDRPLLFHMNGFIDDAFDACVDEQFLAKLNRLSVELLSCDLGPSCRRTEFDPSREDCYVAPDGPLEREEILAIARRKAEFVRRHFKGLLSLENLDYHDGGAYEHIVEPAFITELVTALGVGLTVDIGHLGVTCWNRGWDAYEYVEQLPLDRVIEIHFSHSENGLDLHGPPQEEDYEMLRYVLHRTSPKYLCVEYYWDPTVIVSSYRKIWEVLESHG